MATLPSAFATMIPKPKKAVSCQELVNGLNSHSGFIRKQPESKSSQLLGGLVRRKWPKKYVVLSAGCVYIYDSEKSERCERASSLFGYDRVEVDQDTTGLGLHGVFKLTNDLDDRPKVLRFAADSDDDRTVWMDKFSKEIMASNSVLLKLNGMSTGTASSRPVASTLSVIDKRKIRESIRSDELVYVDVKEADDDVEYDDVSNLQITTHASNVNCSRPAPSSGSDIDSDFNSTAIYDEVSLHITPQMRTLPALPTDSAIPPRGKRKTPVPVPPIEPAETAQSGPPPVTPKPLISAAKPTPPPMMTKPTVATKPPKSDSLAQASGKAVEAKIPLNQRTVPPLPNQQSHDDTTPIGTSARGIPEDYEQCTVKSPNANVSAISDDDCLADPLVRNAFSSLDKHQCYSIMSSCSEEGTFLLRASSAQNNPSKTLVVRTLVPSCQLVKYCIGKSQEGTYQILQMKEALKFQSIGSLLRHYQLNFLPNRTTKLSKPFSEVMNS